MNITRTPRPLFAVVMALAVVASACSTTTTDTDTTADGDTTIKLQLQWFKQGQFAGYLAAVDQGFYAEQGLDVEILDGGTDIVPQTVLAQGQADYAVAWVPKALASREAGAGITDVAQIYQKSGTLQVSFKDQNIASPADLQGKTVGNWGYGNEFELFAGMTKAGVSPSDVTLVQQQFDMNGLLSGDIAAAQAMSYNEYAQLLETVNPATGALYTADDFASLNWNDDGVAMLQDAIWANTDKLSDEAYQEQTVKFLAASLKGWIFCRDNVEKCRDITVAAGSTLGASHQLWQVNEVNKLIWPSADGIGMIDEAAWQQTVDIAKTTKNAEGSTVLTADPDAEAYTNEYVSQALDLLKADGVDVTGESYAPMEVTLEEGGK
ncbi:ABC transporter substrate-binding protein [Rhodococcus sp. 05-340-1]|jgi:NitT/TauT family transport system substrate-binding protein|uniref:ABC transporter substrate-binding protein n=1 Tax=Nocardiaceae TaxID=85025 RepID=UPI00055EC284|nr:MULTISPECIES: ABC transporter substrate-binding protein [Rhodococcus]OZD69729.1 ABC transporter substrate-binding protein [Rhodococcus sp. 05-340-1]OZD70463.1 ABC transporter substrate-binding protein [Rhodococcus sp. 05-340-2]OZF03823.1 ABC transporter substrate-binding protein [Rhodococcus sp. 15-2388-1-1a]